MLHESFERLESKKNMNTLKRISRMEAILEQMEAELDELVNTK
jgi:hypothetical protein